MAHTCFTHRHRLRKAQHMIQWLCAVPHVGPPPPHLLTRCTTWAMMAKRAYAGASDILQHTRTHDRQASSRAALLHETLCVLLARLAAVDLSCTCARGTAQQAPSYACGHNTDTQR
jgi:hypothetical protein